MRQEDAYDRDSTCAIVTPEDKIAMPLAETWRTSTDSWMDIAKLPNRFAKIHRF